MAIYLLPVGYGEFIPVPAELVPADLLDALAQAYVVRQDHSDGTYKPSETLRYIEIKVISEDRLMPNATEAAADPADLVAAD